jgi:hypothetical protein
VELPWKVYGDFLEILRTFQSIRGGQQLRSWLRSFA